MKTTVNCRYNLNVNVARVISYLLELVGVIDANY